MDENLGFRHDDGPGKSSSIQWYLPHDDSSSLDQESSKLFLQYKNYHLHLIQKKEQRSQRLVIPCTKYERLSYFRSFIIRKTQIVSMEVISFNRLVWINIANTILKSYSHHFVHLFLASYTPEEHLFLSKMIPFMYGVTYFIILTSLFELIDNTETATKILDYLFGSIFLKSPWNRCPDSGLLPVQVYNSIIKLNVSCYNLLDFGKRVENKTVIFDQAFYYIVEDEEWLQLVQFEYLRYFISLRDTYYILHYCFIWAIVSASYKQIYKKQFWVVLNFIHWSTIVFDAISFIYLVLNDFLEEYHEPMKIKHGAHLYSVALEEANSDFFSESMSAPPILHLLNARSTQEILPERDSAILVTSNALYVIFKALLLYQVKRRCESLARVPIYAAFTSDAWLYLWPMYFSTFVVGDIYTLILFMLNFIMQVMVLIVTFECLVEVVLCEFPKIKRWHLFLVFIVTELCFSYNIRHLTLIQFYMKTFAILIECVIIYWMYPIGRLIDDIQFHQGFPPNNFRVKLLYVVPLYYLWKFVSFLSLTLHILMLYGFGEDLTKAMSFIITSMVLSLGLGMIYTVYCYVYRDKKNWTYMFTPCETWGPKDSKLRQLRKEYDSRTFYNSQEPRDLARHIIGKTESKAYHLAIRYDLTRRSTLASEYRNENVKQ